MSAASTPPRALTRWVWGATFAYAALAALLVQLVVLPHLLPAWHSGNGLLVGGDWIAFHNYAVGRGAAIRAQGWGAFQLRPFGNTPIGIASAVYALTWSEPWTLIPLNAGLHATAAALLLHLLRGFVPDWRWAVLGIGPFVLYPSALIWVSQIHKDGWFIVGYLSLFVAWADLARAGGWMAGGRRALARALLLVPAGFGLIWFVRPDLVIVTQAAAVLALLVLVVGASVRRRGERPGWRRAAGILGLVGLVILAALWMANSPTRFLSERSRWAAPPGSDAVSYGVPWRGEPLPSTGEPARSVRAIPWSRTAWLPLMVDHVAYRIALLRDVSLIYYRDSLSNMDLDVGFYRATDLLRHLPRALQVALLAPFPRAWADAGSFAWTTAGRRLVAVEMLGVYGGLLGLVAAGWRWRRRLELWVVALPCLAILALYSLVVPNLGALHRFRYGFLMTLVGLGVAGGLEMLAEARQRRSGPSRTRAAA